MFKLKIIVTSTRPGRKSPAVATWLAEVAKDYSQFETEIIDLAALNLPMMDEPNHPVLQKYEHQHTKDWSKKIGEADAFIIVTPEYNSGFTGVFKNAFDYLFHEWKYKAAGIVSYGGVSGGTRAVQMMKQVLTTASMVPLVEGVIIPFIGKQINDEGIFVPEENMLKSAQTMFSSLLHWTENLKKMR